MAFEQGTPKPEGSGRKKGTPNQRNRVIEDAFAGELTPEKAGELVRFAIQQAESGKPGLLLGLLPYGLQPMPKAAEESGPEDEPLKIIIQHVGFPEAVNPI